MRLPISPVAPGKNRKKFAAGSLNSVCRKSPFAVSSFYEVRTSGRQYKYSAVSAHIQTGNGKKSGKRDGWAARRTPAKHHDTESNPDGSAAAGRRLRGIRLGIRRKHRRSHRKEIIQIFGIFRYDLDNSLVFESMRCILWNKYVVW